jgi:hypothetical protein
MRIDEIVSLTYKLLTDVIGVADVSEARRSTKLKKLDDVTFVAVTRFLSGEDITVQAPQPAPSFVDNFDRPRTDVPELEPMPVDWDDDDETIYVLESMLDPADDLDGEHPPTTVRLPDRIDLGDGVTLTQG